MRIAVVGSGIAGLGSAHFLQRRHDVTLFEQDGRAGGHTNTVGVGNGLSVDTGWIVYNALNYPNLSALFGELGVDTRATQMSFGVSLGDGQYEWKGSDRLLSVFAQPSNLLRPAHLRMLAGILRLNRVCRARLRDGNLPEGSLGEFLDAEGFGAGLRSRYLLPMAGLIWSCSPREAALYPAADFMRFFEAHGLFTTMDQPVWRTVIGGSRTYVDRILQRFRGHVRLDRRVLQLRPARDGVDVVTQAGVERFDRVVCATHADQALALLADPQPLEQRVLGGIPYTGSRCVLHVDASWMPRRRAAWASWNYLHARDEVHGERICGTYWMNLLQGLPGPVNYFVTLNPSRPVAPERVLYETPYQHPLYTAASVGTHQLLPQIQNRRGIAWAGAWCGYGFHEDGLKSALQAVEQLDAQCLPTWAAVVPAQAGTQFPELDSRLRGNDVVEPVVEPS